MDAAVAIVIFGIETLKAGSTNVKTNPAARMAPTIKAACVTVRLAVSLSSRVVICDGTIAWRTSCTSFSNRCLCLLTRSTHDIYNLTSDASKRGGAGGEKDNLHEKGWSFKKGDEESDAN